MSRSGALRGRFLLPEGRGMRVVADGLLEVDDLGRVASLRSAPAACAIPETWPGAVVLPGFVDTHLHFPQARVLGSASGPLLDWLDRTVFPEEARFAARPYAEAVAAEFCLAMAARGTTTASVYSSSHPLAADAVFAALDRIGLRARVGLTLMDRGAPAGVLLAAGPALDACRALVERWHGRDRGRLQFAVTPRFALSCSPELLRCAGRLATDLGLPVQTHLSENRAEVAATAAAFPESADYLAVYADHGLLGPHCLFAHCIWLGDGEWDRLAAAGAAVAHCPDSNFFLGSGCLRLRDATGRGVRVGLGTDVGAGRTFSVRQVVAAAYDAALVRGARVAAAELLWHATAGGADALGLGGVTGRLAPGEDADLAVVDLPAETSDDRVADALAFRRDDGPVRATVVRGRVVVGSGGG